jgi:hypothetical protein
MSTTSLVCQEELDAEAENSSRLSIHVEGSPIVDQMLGSAFLGLEFDALNDPNRPFALNLKTGIGYVYFSFFGVTEGIGGYVGTNFLFGRKHFAEVNLCLFGGNDTNSQGFGFGGGESSTGPFLHPIVSLGYRYKNPKGKIIKSGVGTTGIYFGLGTML